MCRRMLAPIAFVAAFAMGSFRTPLDAFGGVAFAQGDKPPNVKLLHASVQVIYGSHAKEPFIDPPLAEDQWLKARLLKAPFASYNSFRQLAKRDVELAWKQPTEVPLVGGRRLHLGYPGMKEQRFRVTGMIDRADGFVFLKQLEVSASSGEPFFLAQEYDNGVLVLKISVKP